MTVQLLDDTPAVLSFGKHCEEHGNFYEWASGQKPQLTKNGKIILCNTENFVPIVVTGLSTCSSSSSPSSCSTSLSQDSSSTSPSPARVRSDDTHVQASGNRGDLTRTKHKNKNKHTIKQRVICCEISQIGQRSSLKISKKLVNSTPHTSHFLMLHNTLFNVTSTMAQVWRAAHISLHASSSCAHVCLILCDSPFYFLLSIFLPIVSFILLVVSFFFHDVEGKYPVHSR